MSENISSTSGAIVWLNGEVVDPGQASLRWDDHGLTVGDGVFETIKTVGAHPFALEPHLDRRPAVQNQRLDHRHSRAQPLSSRPAILDDQPDRRADQRRRSDADQHQSDFVQRLRVSLFGEDLIDERLIAIGKGRRVEARVRVVDRLARQKMQHTTCDRHRGAAAEHRPGAD